MTAAEKRAAALRDAAAIRDTARAASRDLTDDEITQIDSHVATAEAAGQEITREDARTASVARLDAATAAASAPRARITDPNAERSAVGVALVSAIGAAVATPALLADPMLGFRSFGHFARAVHGAGPHGVANDPALRALAAATGMSQGIGPDGGFLMAPAFVAQVWDEMRKMPDNLLGMVDNYTLEPGQESLTFPANAETSRATGSRYGGVQGYWLAEADQIGNTKPKLRQVKVEAHQLAVLCYVTDKLLMNSPTALEQYLGRAAVDEINVLTSIAIFNGTGAGQPAGLLGSGSLISVPKETSQAALTINQENIAKMWARMPARHRMSAVWLANQDIEPQLDLMVTLVKNVAGTENVGGFQAGLYDKQAGTLKGRPVVFIEPCPTLGTVGDLVLWQPKSYLAVTRGGGIQQAVSMHLRFDYAESAFRFMFEVGGQPWLNAATTPLNGTNTLSTHVALATRA